MAGIAVLGILGCHFYVLCKITRRLSPWVASVLWFYTFVTGLGIVFNYVYSWGNADDLKLSKKIFWIWTGFFVQATGINRNRQVLPIDTDGLAIGSKEARALLRDILLQRRIIASIRRRSLARSLGNLSGNSATT